MTTLTIPAKFHVEGYSDAVMFFDAETERAPTVSEMLADAALVQSIADRTMLTGGALTEAVHAYAVGFCRRAAEDAAAYASRPSDD